MMYIWACSRQYFQVTIIMLNVLSALAASIVKYLSPWPMLLMALLLFIPIFPSLCSSQQEGKLPSAVEETYKHVAI